MVRLARLVGLHFLSKNTEKTIVLFVPGGSFLELFGVLGAPWPPSGAKGALEIVLGCIFGEFRLPFGTPWAHFLQHFRILFFDSKKC